MNYTQGEWKYEEELLANMSMISCDNKVIAGIPNDVSEDAGAYLEQVANANLIAAAPDMYEALLSALGSLIVFDTKDHTWVKSIINNIQKVLIKAESK